MSKRIHMSRQTRSNWLIDAAVLVGGLLAALSGIYFLFLPSGGYRGGRNPAYGIQILFERHTWSDLHTWTGVLMIAAAVIHLLIHWRWVKMMAGRVTDVLRGGEVRMSQGAWRNLALDATVAASFAFCAVSGIALLFLPSGGHGAQEAGLVFGRTTWDLIHTWSGVVLIASAIVHLSIHWRWVKNVTKRFFQSLLPQRAADEMPVTAGQLVR